MCPQHISWLGKRREQASSEGEVQGPKDRRAQRESPHTRAFCCTQFGRVLTQAGPLGEDVQKRNQEMALKSWKNFLSQNWHFYYRRQALDSDW